MADHYAALHHGFHWQVDEYFNIADVCCKRWAEQGAIKKVAVHAHKQGLTAIFYTYFELQKAADALSHVLSGLGVQRGDRVAIVMPQRFETAVAYMAVFQMGAVAMPLSMLFGPEALAFRLMDSEAVVAMVDRERGAVVKAYVVLAPDLVAARARIQGSTAVFDAEITAKLQLHVKNMLAPYEYPKEIEFIDALPMTTTGKVQRRVLRLQEEARFKNA